MSAEWFILSNKQSVGPYTLDAVAGLIDEGAIAPNTLVRRLSGSWMPAGQACGRPSGAAPSPPEMLTAMPIADEVADPNNDVEHEEDYEAARAAARRRRAKIMARLATPFAILIGGATAVGAYVGFKHLFAPIQRAEHEEPEAASKPKPKSTRPIRKSDTSGASASGS